MHILTSFPKEKIAQLNKVINQFSRYSEKAEDDCVALVIEGDDFSENLSTASGLGIPVVIIAGLKSAGKKHMQEAMEVGVPERCIIFKDHDNIVSADGHVFARSPRGISVRAISEIALYALENKLYPELFVWQEPVVEEIWPEPVRTAVQKATPRAEKQQRLKKHIVSEELPAFLSKAPVLAVFKSVPTINSAPTTKLLAEKLNGIHLEINDVPHSFQLYASSKEKAMQDNYAFSAGKIAEYGVFQLPWIVAEINPAMIDVMGLVYEKAAKVIYVVEDLDNSEAALDMWIEGGYKLDAIIPDQINITAYKAKYGDTVFELGNFINQMERR